MKYFILGNHLSPSNMSIEEAYASWRSIHNDIQQAFLNYADVVAVARTLQAQDKKIRPIIQIDVSKNAEEPLAIRFNINGETIKDKNRAVYLTMVSRAMHSYGEETELTLLDASFDYSNQYTPTISFKSSTIDFAKVRAEMRRISEEEFSESIKSSEQYAKEQALKDILANKTKDGFMPLQQALASGKAEEQAAKAKAEEQAAKAQADEQAEKVKAEEQAAKAKAEEQAAKAKADEQAAKAQAEEQVAKAQADEQAAKAKAEEQAAKAKAEEQAINVKVNDEHPALITRRTALTRDSVKGLDKLWLEKIERRIDARNQERAYRKKIMYQILFGIIALTAAGGALMTLLPTLWAPFVGKTALMILAPIFTLYAAKKGWDKFKDRNQTSKLEMEVDTLLYNEGYDLKGSKFGNELRKMSKEFLSDNQPLHVRREVLLWQKETLNRVAAVKGFDRKVIKQQLLEEGKQKFKF